MKKTICLLLLSMLFFPISKSKAQVTNYQVVMDNPYHFNKIRVELEPMSFDMHLLNPINTGVFVRGYYNLNKKTNVYTDLFISYIDGNKMLSDDKLKRFLRSETHISYDFRNKEKKTDIGVVTNMQSNMSYEEAVRKGYKNITTTTSFIMVPGTTRKTISLNGSLDFIRTSVNDADRDKTKSSVTYNAKSNSSSGGDSTFSIPANINANYFMPVLTGGISFKRMHNLKTRINNEALIYASNTFRNFGIDVLYAPLITVNPAREYSYDLNRVVDYNTIGWRIVYELNHAEKYKPYYKPNLFKQWGMYYRFEFGQRPGPAGRQAYLVFGMGWRLIDK